MPGTLPCLPGAPLPGQLAAGEAGGRAAARRTGLRIRRVERTSVALFRYREVEQLLAELGEHGHLLVRLPLKATVAGEFKLVCDVTVTDVRHPSGCSAVVAVPLLAVSALGLYIGCGATRVPKPAGSGL